MPDGRQWNGLIDDDADIGDGLLNVVNSSLYIKGILRRRPGFGAKIVNTNPIVSLDEVGSSIVTCELGGNIRAYDQTSGAISNLATGYVVTPSPNMAPAFNRMYITNGSQAVKVVGNPPSIRDAGIAAPVTAVTATLAAGTVGSIGTHLVRYRYKDATNNRLSNPTAIVTITSTAGQQTINVGVTASTDPTITNILVEMTPAGSSAFYVANVAANATATVSISIADDNLVLLTATAVNGDTGHAPPPMYSLIVQHRQRLWMMNPPNGLLVWSQPGFPESFDTVNNGRIVSLVGADTATALFSFFTDLYICGQRSMQRMVYTTDPAGAYLLPVVGSYGAFNQRCVVRTSTGDVFGWGRDGMWRINSMQPAKISKRIATSIDTLVDKTQITNRFVTYDPIEQCVLFFFCLQGEIVPRGAFAYYPNPSNPDAEWVQYTYRQGMTGSCYNSNFQDVQRTALATANGYTWRIGSALNDGTDGSNLVVTSATTTVVQGTNQSTPGEMVFRPATDETRLVTVATAGAITVAPAFATAPIAGELIYCGSIPQTWTTQYFTSLTAADKKRPSYLKMMFHPNPGNNGTFIVRFYLDFATTPTAVTSDNGATWPNGVSIVNGTDITVDVDAGGTDGYIAVPIPNDFNRAVQAEIIANYPGKSIRVYDFQWGFTNKTQEATMASE